MSKVVRSHLLETTLDLMREGLPCGPCRIRPQQIPNGA